MTELICEKDIRSQKAMVESRDIYNLCNNLLLCLTNEMQHMHAIFKLEAQWAEPVSLTCHFVLRKLYTEPTICASYQISIDLAKQF